MLTNKLFSIYNHLRQPMAERPTPRPLNVTVYSRDGCHLCDEAVDLLAEFGLRANVVDIDQDPDLVARYDCCVPVVEIDGKIRFRGHVNRVLLQRLVQRP